MTTDTVLHFLEQTKEASKPSNSNHLRKNMYTYNQIYIEILFFSFLQMNVLISANQRMPGKHLQITFSDQLQCFLGHVNAHKTRRIQHKSACHAYANMIITT